MSFSAYLRVSRSSIRSGRTFILYCLFSSCVAGAQAPPLTLNDAISRTRQFNPSLKVFDLQTQGLQALKQSAELTPAYHVEVEIENFAGQGKVSGIESSEQTLALSSVIELGRKRAARVALADLHINHKEAERQARALDILSQVTQQYVATVAAQQRVNLAADANDLARRTLNAVRRRAQAGAAPDAEVLRAEAALAQAGIALAHQVRDLKTNKVRLAAFWGATDSDYPELRGNLFDYPATDDFEALYNRAQNNASMALYASEARLKEAEVQLARRSGKADVAWRLGVRRFEGTGDTGVVAGVSVPLFPGQRSRGEVRHAEAARDEVEMQHQSALLTLYVRLFEAYQYREQAIENASTLEHEVIPALNRALEDTRRAFEQGRYRYVDLVEAQRELLDAENALIDAASAALTYGAVIEQLTAEPLSSIE